MTINPTPRTAKPRSAYAVMRWLMTCALGVALAGLFDKGHTESGTNFPYNLVHSRQMRFEHISLEDGLSQGSVNCILQDRKGFLWFGTDDGLNRYDGYQFRVFRHDLEEPNSLSDDYINFLLEDDNGMLWIGTDNGLNRFDPALERFTRFLTDAEDPNHLGSSLIRAIYEDRSGHLWIGTRSGLFRYDRDSEEFIPFRNQPSDPNSLSNNSISVITEDREGSLWIGTTNGLNRLLGYSSDGSRPAFIRYFPDPDTLGNPSTTSIMSICDDRTGSLWIGTEGGLYRMIENDPVSSDPYFVHRPLNPERTQKGEVERIKIIYEDTAGNLWIGTWETGLNRYDRDEDRFIRYGHQPEVSGSLSHDFVESIFEDRTGVLWIGTSNGINKYDRTKIKFSHFQADPNDPNGLTHDYVWSIFEDRSGTIWIGTGGGGLNRLIPDAEIETSPRFTHFRHDPVDRSSLSSDYVTAIYEDRFGSLWIGTLGGGLNRLMPDSTDDASLRFHRYSTDPDDPNSLSGDDIFSFSEDVEGDLWIGTYGTGLNRLVRGSLQESSVAFERYTNDPDDPNSLSHNTIYTLCTDRSGALWIGTYGAGLNRLIPGTTDGSPPTFRRYLHRAGDPDALSDNSILCIHDDREGTLWIGTEGGGLNRFDRSSETFHHYTMKDGLPNNVVYGILEDGNGSLWLSTNRGLSRFDPDTETFRNYRVSDGLQSNEFNSNAYCSSRSGVMLFGGVNGFNAFHPNSVRDDPTPPPIAITAFKLFNKVVPIGLSDEGRTILERSISDTELIKLSYGDNVLTFEFAGLHFSSPKENRYACMLEGLDKDWMDIGSTRMATYTHLPAGQYTFRVKAANHDNVWNETGASIGITILPPFWQTTWFRGAMLLSIVLTLFTGYRKRISLIEAKRKALEERVQERTRAAEKLQGALDEVERLKNRLEAENVYLQDEIKIEHNFENIITRSDRLKTVLRDLERVSSTDATVLILGESGTGKELFARAIHNISARGDRPLVKVDCGVLPYNLIESELFGHEKGAFTGAIARKEGRFTLADGGSIFLDEIGDLPLKLQSKLLRVLQDGEFESVGSTKTVRVDVRIIAATNRDLTEEVKKGNFREDLFYRLNVFPILIPPLRDRKDDIPLLVNHFVKRYAKKTGKPIESIPQHVLDSLCAYDWPGNVRELENIIERAVIVSPGNTLSVGDWLPRSGSTPDGRTPTLEEVERNHILQALEQTGWRVSGEKGAAKILGINPKTLDSRMRKLNIRRPR